tara:strand:+ start:840 stop:1310 length:471 start_codon:yes stop_codon:yes gene_type:complete
MSKILEQVLKTDNGISQLALRLPVGVILLAHGAQKLFGWFGGYGLEGTGQYMSSLGLDPGYLMAMLAGSAEFFGGLALIFGLLMRPASVVLAFTMLVAMLSAHIGNGLFLSNGGYEFALVLMVVTVSLAISGGGRLSLDRLLTRHLAMVEPQRVLV